MNSISCYEVAYKMQQQNISVEIIAATLEKSRATIYRWLQGIRRSGIQSFLKRKKTCKIRRPKAKTPEYIAQLIVDIRQEKGYCGAKIQKELRVKHGIRKSLATIYRILHERLTRNIVGVKRYQKHEPIVKSYAPREVVEHDTVDLGGGKYAFTSIDVFTKEPVVVIGTDLTMQSGKEAFMRQKAYYGNVKLHQSDNGSEFQTDFVEAVIATGSKHRYSRPYKKNEQSHIENFNRSLRAECFQYADYARWSVEEMQKEADKFCHFYIYERWHMGLPDMMTPAEFKDYYNKDPEHAKLELATLQAKRYGKRKILICD